MVDKLTEKNHLVKVTPNCLEVEKLKNNPKINVTG